MATIRDVARMAEVSVATVSRVLNGSNKVSEKTRHRVWDAAKQLDYWPNTAARSLTTRRTQSLGVLLPDLYGDFFSEVIRGINHGARREKYQVLISSSHANSEEVMLAARSLRGRIDGLIMMAPDQASAESLDRIARRFRLLLLNPREQIDGCAAVSIANYQGAYVMTRHLLGLGHRSIAMVKGPVGNVDAEERFRGYQSALRDAGIEADPSLEFSGDFTEFSGYRAASQIFSRSTLPSAVFAANDSMAVGLLSAFATLGIEIPAQVAVTGFDDISIAKYMRPPLTSVHVDAYRLGERAVELLIASLRSSDATFCDHEVLPTPLIVRRSCGSETASPIHGFETGNSPAVSETG